MAAGQGNELGIRRANVQCPQCNAELHVPSRIGAARVRCGLCHHAFTLSPHNVAEDLVASWLTDEPAPVAPRPPPGPAGLATAGRSPPAHPVGHPAAQRVRPLPQANREIRIVALETSAVLVEFPAHLLESDEFRCSMPRRCVQCGVRTHLGAHVIIFAGQLVDSLSLEAEHSTRTLQLNNAEIQGLSGPQVLERLRPVPKVQPPGDLPMPYWLCDMCSGAGMICGQIQVNPEARDGFCRLKIGSIYRALEFMRNCGAEGTADFQRLHDQVDRTAESPWAMLPEVVQHRVQQWFQPAGAEVFLAYVPDRDHVRTGDGMAGLLLSSERLVYHTPMRHRESSVRESVELKHSVAMIERKEAISVQTPSWSVKQMSVDRDGLTHLRRALTIGGYQVLWR
jgi:hypothetical protein